MEVRVFGTMLLNLVDKFQLSNSCRCAVLSITAANAGITLTAAQLVLFAELHWNPGIIIQAESRAHRIGQTGDVCVRFLLAKGTSDDLMWPMLQSKLNVLNEVGLCEDKFDQSTLRLQENQNSMLNYLVSPKPPRASYIPGTNIRRDATNCTLLAVGSHEENTIPVETSFLEDSEGDDLLADIDI